MAVVEKAKKPGLGIAVTGAGWLITLVALIITLSGERSTGLLRLDQHDTAIAGINTRVHETSLTTTALSERIARMEGDVQWMRRWMERQDQQSRGGIRIGP